MNHARRAEKPDVAAWSILAATGGIEGFFLVSLSLALIQLCVYFVVAAGSPIDGSYWPNARWHMISSATDLSLGIRSTLAGGLSAYLCTFPRWDDRQRWAACLAVFIVFGPGYSAAAIAMAGDSVRSALGWLLLQATCGAVGATGCWLLRRANERLAI